METQVTNLQSQVAQLIMNYSGNTLRPAFVTKFVAEAAERRPLHRSCFEFFFNSDQSPLSELANEEARDKDDLLHEAFIAVQSGENLKSWADFANYLRRRGDYCYTQALAALNSAPYESAHLLIRFNNLYTDAGAADYYHTEGEPFEVCGPEPYDPTQPSAWDPFN